jgi:hypothetical protein
VFTDDSTVIRGSRLFVNTTSSILCMRSDRGSGVAANVHIPFAKVSTITYRKPGHARWALAFLGLGLGAVAGGLTGAALAPESESWLDFSSLHCAGLGAMIGGLAGLAGGYQVGKQFTVKVELHCR